jgi:hypothetical protein
MYFIKLKIIAVVQFDERADQSAVIDSRTMLGHSRRSRLASTVGLPPSQRLRGDTYPRPTVLAPAPAADPRMDKPNEDLLAQTKMLCINAKSVIRTQRITYTPQNHQSQLIGIINNCYPSMPKPLKEALYNLLNLLMDAGFLELGINNTSILNTGQDLPPDSNAKIIIQNCINLVSDVITIQSPWCSPVPRDRSRPAPVGEPSCQFQPSQQISEDTFYIHTAISPPPRTDIPTPQESPEYDLQTPDGMPFILDKAPLHQVRGPSSEPIILNFNAMMEVRRITRHQTPRLVPVAESTPRPSSPRESTDSTSPPASEINISLASESEQIPAIRGTEEVIKELIDMLNDSLSTLRIPEEEVDYTEQIQQIVQYETSELALQKLYELLNILIKSGFITPKESSDNKTLVLQICNFPTQQGSEEELLASEDITYILKGLIVCKIIQYPEEFRTEE